MINSWDFLEASGVSTGSYGGSVELPLVSPSSTQELDARSVDAVTGAGLAVSPSVERPEGPVVDRLTGVAQGVGGERSPELFTYIVTLETEGRPLAERAQDVLGVVRPDALFANLGMLTVRLTAAQAQALARRPGVLGVEQDQVVTLSLPDGREAGALRKPGSGGGESTSEFLDWGVHQVWGGVDRRSTAFSFSNRAFVLDTGISANTGDLNFNTTLSKDFTGSRSDFYDKHGHGTHVAGTIAAQANNRGVIGVAPNAEVVSIKVLNDRGSGSISGIIAGIDYMISQASSGDVANMSLGSGLSQALNDAVLKAATSNKKIRFAIAAGNSYQDVDATSPASVGDVSKGIYTISAHDINKRNASFTNFDNLGSGDVDNVAYAAPGVNITSLKIDGGTVAYNGTSMAAPHVAGLLLIGGFAYTTTTGTFAFGYGSESTDPLAITNMS